MDSPFSHAVFAQELELDYPLLSDFNREAFPLYSGFYDEYRAGLKGVGRRAVYVVGRDGLVHYRWLSEKSSDLPDVNEVLAAVRKLA